MFSNVWYEYNYNTQSANTNLYSYSSDPSNYATGNWSSRRTMATRSATAARDGAEVSRIGPRNGVAASTAIRLSACSA